LLIVKLLFSSNSREIIFQFRAQLLGYLKIQIDGDMLLCAETANNAKCPRLFFQGKVRASIISILLAPLTLCALIARVDFQGLGLISLHRMQDELAIEIERNRAVEIDKTSAAESDLGIVDLDVMDTATLLTQCGIHALKRAAYAFDSLEVSVRAALPSSSLPSDVLGLTVAALHDAYVAAFREGLGCIVAEADVDWFPLGIEAYREALAAYRCAQTFEDQELHVDEKLRDLRTRLKRAEATELELGKFLEEGRETCTLLDAISAEIVDVPDVTSFRDDVLATNRVVQEIQVLLDEESERVPSLAKVKRALERAKLEAREIPTSRTAQGEELTNLQRGEGIDEIALTQLASQLTRPIGSM
jgi:hypothetical protein